MFQQKRAALRAGRITDANAMATLASPVRQELIDTLEALGGVATIAELAAQLGRPADGLYYHVAQLRRAGLIVAAPGATSRAGRSERRYATISHPGPQLRLIYDPRDARRATALRDVVGGMLRITRRDFDRALADGARRDAAHPVVVDGPRRELWAARGTGWVSDAELAEANRLLTRLAQLLRRPRTKTRQRLISLCFVLTPVAAKPVRRARAVPGRSRKRSQS